MGVCGEGEEGKSGREKVRDIAHLIISHEQDLSKYTVHVYAIYTILLLF
jgi:hypothetical protein